MDRKHIQLPVEDLEIASRITGKTEPVEIFRELVRMTGSQPTILKQSEERQYWQTRNLKARTLRTEFQLGIDIGVVQKIKNADGQMGLPTRIYCFNCHAYYDPETYAKEHVH